MRPGRIKHKARARHRRVAVTCAGVSALTVMGGTAAFATGAAAAGTRTTATRHSTTAATPRPTSTRHQSVFTAQLALANTGANHASASRAT